jgi:hypothetical protein
MRLAALILAAVLLLVPAAEAKRDHGKKGKRPSASVRFKVKKQARQRERVRSLTKRSPRVLTDWVGTCFQYPRTDPVRTGEWVRVCSANGGPITTCEIYTPAYIKPCPPGPIPRPPVPLPE